MRAVSAKAGMALRAAPFRDVSGVCHHSDPLGLTTAALRQCMFSVGLEHWMGQVVRPLAVLFAAIARFTLSTERPL